MDAAWKCVNLIAWEIQDIHFEVLADSFGVALRVVKIKGIRSHKQNLYTLVNDEVAQVAKIANFHNP